MIEILNRPIVRTLLVGVVALALQTTVLADMRIGGVVVQLLLAMSVAAGVSAGSEKGAMAGFTLGLLLDLTLTSPLGLSALVYGAAGFLGGYFHSKTLENPRWLDAIGLGVLSAVATFAFPVVANWVGVEGWISTRVIRVVIVVSVVNLVIAPLVVPVMRWTQAVRREQRLSMTAGVPL